MLEGNIRMLEIDRIIRNALQEDIGPGDVTTLSTIEPGTSARAELVAKEEFVLAGIDVAGRVFELLEGGSPSRSSPGTGSRYAAGRFSPGSRAMPPFFSRESGWLSTCCSA